VRLGYVTSGASARLAGEERRTGWLRPQDHGLIDRWINLAVGVPKAAETSPSSPNPTAGRRRSGSTGSNRSPTTATTCSRTDAGSSPTGLPSCARRPRSTPTPTGRWSRVVDGVGFQGQAAGLTA
jgi:hypothetical protein